MHFIIFITGILNIYIEYRQRATCERELHPEQNPNIENIHKKQLIFILSWDLKRFFCNKLIK